MSNSHGINLVNENSDAGHIKFSCGSFSLPLPYTELISSTDLKSTWL